MHVVLGTKLADLAAPQMLSQGLIAHDVREHYVELDVASETARARRRASRDFVRFDGVLNLWDRVPSRTWSPRDVGRRAGEWLLGLAGECGMRIAVLFGYATDYALLESAIRDSEILGRARDVVRPIDIGPLAGSPEGEDAADEHFRTLSNKGLARHHALANAGTRRAAYVAVKSIAAQWPR